jgi:hypothetical protein
MSVPPPGREQPDEAHRAGGQAAARGRCTGAARDAAKPSAARRPAIMWTAASLAALTVAGRAHPPCSGPRGQPIADGCPGDRTVPFAAAVRSSLGRAGDGPGHQGSPVHATSCRPRQRRGFARGRPHRPSRPGAVTLNGATSSTTSTSSPHHGPFEELCCAVLRPPGQLRDAQERSLGLKQFFEYMSAAAA